MTHARSEHSVTIQFNTKQKNYSPQICLQNLEQPLQLQKLRIIRRLRLPQLGAIHPRDPIPTRKVVKVGINIVNPISALTAHVLRDRFSTHAHHTGHIASSKKILKPWLERARRPPRKNWAAFRICPTGDSTREAAAIWPALIGLFHQSLQFRIAVLLPKQLEPQKLVLLPQGDDTLIQHDFRDQRKPVQRAIGHVMGSDEFESIWEVLL